ncbi:aldo/keto reductase [Streptomyces sp. NPDC005438]|uniref:aldo/keto reductase n=1 Tax=Streptomyces sp. NPDC005438 TaxID=3156880 RepID=UPI0033B8A2CB
MSETITLGGDLTVRRSGFGAMRLTGPGAWGEPEDRAGAIAVARRAVELGIDFVDTADAYGPGNNEELLAEALRPYPEGLVIATKVGQARPGPWEWVPLARPEYIRQQAELSLRRLGLERIDLYQLHRIDPQVPLAEQLGTLGELRDEGKVRHLGLSEVTVAEIEEARRHIEVVSVQNRYNLVDRDHDPVVDYCEREGIAFIPWQPVKLAELDSGGEGLASVAGELGVTLAQVALAWLYHRSPAILPIPGTSSVRHLEENHAASELSLSKEQLARLG